MKTLILLAATLLTSFNAFSAIRTQSLHRGESVTGIIYSNDIHAYTAKFERGTFVSLFLTEHDIMLTANLKDKDGKVIDQFISSKEFGNILVLEYYPEKTAEYTIEIAHLNNVGVAKYSLDFSVQIPVMEKLQKDRAYNTSVFENDYFSFKTDDETTICVGPSLDFLAYGKLTYYNSKTGRTGILYPLTDSTFYSPYIPYDRYSDDIEVVLHRKGTKINSVTWKENDIASTSKVSSSYRMENVSFDNGNANLQGMLMLPDGIGPFPAVVLTQSNGAPTRNKGFIISYLLEQGIAVLSFDKRGTGESSGSWIRSSISELDNDLIAAAAYLGNHGQIDTYNMGIYALNSATLKPVNLYFNKSSNSMSNFNDTVIHPVRENNEYIMKSVFNDPLFKRTVTMYNSLITEASLGMPYRNDPNFL